MLRRITQTKASYTSYVSTKSYRQNVQGGTSVINSVGARYMTSTHLGVQA